MGLSKENNKGRKLVRTLVEHAGLMGHVAAFPIRVVFKPSLDCFGHADLKGSGNNRYFELALDSEFMETTHGRDLCVVIAVHELAHIYTWTGNDTVEEAKTNKYGSHGPEFGVVYAQLWTDLMDGVYGNSTLVSNGNDDNNNNNGDTSKGFIDHRAKCRRKLIVL